MAWQDEQKSVATGVTDGTAIKVRNDILEEVAAEIERFTFAFGVDTVQSFAAFVRSMKD